MATKPPSRKLNAECPICRFEFSTGILGWDKHVAALKNHPDWHPNTTDGIERQRLFAEQFPEFFAGALTPGRRTPLSMRSPAHTPGGYRPLPPPVHKPRPTPGSGSYRTAEPNTDPQGHAVGPKTHPPSARCPTCGGPVEVTYRSRK